MITGFRSCLKQQLMHYTRHHRHLPGHSAVARFSSVRCKSNSVNPIAERDFSTGIPDSENTNNPSTDPDYLCNSPRIERILALKYPDLSIKYLMNNFSWKAEELELRESLEDNPNPLNLGPRELSFMKKYPGVQIRQLTEFDMLDWMELHADSFIEERMPYWFPWWTTRTGLRTEFSPVILPQAKKNPKFIRLAHFAIREHNKKENAHLEFVRLEGVCHQTSLYTRYHIIFEARDAAAGGEKGLYRALVLVCLLYKTTEFLEMVPMMQQPPTLLPEVSASEESND